MSIVCFVLDRFRMSEIRLTREKLERNFDSMRVLVRGYFGYDNLGDEAILTSMLTWVASHEWEAVVLAGPGRDRLIEVARMAGIRRYRFFSTSFLNELRAIIAVDALVIGGGGLFPSDSFKLPLRLLILVLFAALLGKRSIMVGIGVNPIRRRSTKFIWRLLMRVVEGVSVRDSSSYGVLNSILDRAASRRRVFRCADVALALDPEVCAPVVDVSGEPQTRKSVSIVVAKPWSDDELKDQRLLVRFESLCVELRNIAVDLTARGFEVRIVPFFLPGDLEFAEKIVGTASVSEIVVVNDKSIAGRLRSLRGSDLVVTMRFHGLVFGVLFKKPVCVIAYDHKLDELAREAGLSGQVVQLGIRATEFYGREFDIDYSKLWSLVLRSAEDPNSYGIQPACWTTLIAEARGNFSIADELLAARRSPSCDPPK